MAWWYMPLITEAEAGGSISWEFEATLVYKESSKTTRAVTQKKPVSKNQQKGKKKAS